MEGNDPLRAFARHLNDPCLKSTARILIIVSLGINRKLGFLDIMQLTGLGKGSVSNHLERLEDAGYIKTRRILTFNGHRVIAEITEKGIEVYNSYLETIGSLLEHVSREQQERVEQQKGRDAGNLFE